MPRKPRRQWTDEEIKTLRTFAGIRLPEDQQCAHFGMSRTYFDEMIKKSDAAQRAIERGRADAEAKVRETLYTRAVGRDQQVITDPRTGNQRVIPAVEVNQRALEFWCRSQLGFKTTEIHELTGPGGESLDKLSESDLDARIAKISARLNGRGRRGEGRDG